ncbi:hypothetical protein V1508DRAFT_457751 [Lipomyces doorenjongii]|uniref:uncharacterized protein n=1 Tax=Lipomyces doorenjongii TaxID=383834 RepID=UPI0034CF327F
MADNACSLAVRTAYMLGLHLEPPQTMPRREKEMRKRLWWMLECHLAHLEPTTPSLCWRPEQPTQPSTTNVPNTSNRSKRNVILSTDISALEIEQFAPLWLQRQRLLLELMYHNLCTNLYRPSISFALVGAPYPLTDRTAMKCAAHAVALTHMMHQWQWNAAMTLVGSGARSAIDLSVAVFENFGNSFAVAASAASIMSDLSTEVDLFIQSQGMQGVAMQPATNCEESGDESLINGNSIAAPAVDGLLSFDDDNAVEISVLAQSIDIFAAETYNDFDWSGININISDQWAFTQQ